MFFLSRSCILQGRGIVTSDLLVAEAQRPGSHVVGVAVKLDGNEASGIVRAHWAKDNVGLGLLDATEADFIIHADRGGSYIHGVHRSIRDPILLQFNEFLQALSALFRIELGEAELSVGRVHTLKVFVGAE